MGRPGAARGEASTGGELLVPEALEQGIGGAQVLQGDGKTRHLLKGVSGGRKNDKTFTECGFFELRRRGRRSKD